MSEFKVSTATKDDLKMALQTMKKEILDETNTATKTAATVAVEPLNDEVVDLKKIFKTLETKQVSAASSGDNAQVTALQKLVSSFEQEVNCKKVSFSG